MKHIIIIATLLIITSCSKSNVVIKPIKEPQQYIIDLSLIKIEAVLNGETLNGTITNLSHGPIAIDEPWFGPCYTFMFTQKLMEIVSIQREALLVCVLLNSTEVKR